MRSLDILMVASEGPPTRSGIARTIKHLRDGFAARGHRVEVISFPRIPRAVFGEVRLSGLLFHLRGLGRRLDEYDLVHVHGSAPTVSDVFLLFSKLRGRRAPLVYTHHCDIEVGPARQLNTLYNRLHHLLSSTADQFVSTTFDYLAGAGQDANVSFIPLGVDLERFNRVGSKDREFSVLFVGQFRPYKGAQVLIRAMAEVHGAKLLMAGRGPQEQEYRALAGRLGLDAEFHVGVEDEQIAELYRRAHAVVLPSITRAEAFGLVLLEGMAAGCVPVASDLPGVREVLGRIGFTFPAGSAKGLAQTLRRLRDDPALIDQVGARARKRANSFTWDRTVADYERLFGDLVAARELRVRLADRSHADGQALMEFLEHVAANLEADRSDFLLRAADSEVHSVASTLGHGLGQYGLLPDSAALLAQYACETGESALLAPGRAPRAIVERLNGWSGSAIAAPLTAHGAHFGSLVATRARPFDQRDLDGLLRLAFHAAPGLRSWQPMRSTSSALAALRI